MYNNMGKSQRNYTEWKKPDDKEQVFYHFIYIKFYEMQINLFL